ncbi:hypothetical protein TWF696_008638 [Orbilia brochopaga]|uniref:Uncharacterized protein n=1 Tax=Orbilia brochopaga TaxID=3140254 RepID=A0AAV9UHC5_9PEZI
MSAGSRLVKFLVPGPENQTECKTNVSKLSGRTEEPASTTGQFSTGSVSRNMEKKGTADASESAFNLDDGQSQRLHAAEVDKVPSNTSDKKSSRSREHRSSSSPWQTTSKSKNKHTSLKIQFDGCPSEDGDDDTNSEDGEVAPTKDCVQSSLPVSSDLGHRLRSTAPLASEESMPGEKNIPKESGIETMTRGKAGTFSRNIGQSSEAAPIGHGLHCSQEVHYEIERAYWTLRQDNRKLQEMLSAVESREHTANEYIARLRHDVRIYKKHAEEADVKRMEAEDKCNAANAEIKRLQTKEYESTRKGPILLDEDAEQRIEEFFGQRLRAWSRMSFRGLENHKIIDLLKYYEGEGAFNTPLCKEAFLAPMSLAFQKLGPATFFESLISSTLIKSIFKTHFFLAGSQSKTFLTQFRRSAKRVNPESAYAWTAKTVELLENLVQETRQLGQPDDTMVHATVYREFTTLLVGYMRIFMDQYPKLSEDKKATNDMKLEGIIQDCISLALDWHKRNMNMKVIDQEYLMISNDNPHLDLSRYKEFCRIHKSKSDMDEADGNGKVRVLAVVTPGFARFTDFEGRRLPKPIIWSKAVLAIAPDEDIAMEDTVMMV